MKKKNKVGISAAVLCCLVTSGCAVDPRTGQPSFKETFASDDPCSNNARNIGIAVGAIGGALIGSKLGGKSGTLIGAGVAATIGGLIGADMDRKRCELAKLAKKYDLDLTITDVAAPAGGDSSDASAKADKPQAAGLSVSIRDRDTGGHFVSGSDELQPKARHYFADIAAQYSYDQQLKQLPANATADMRNMLESLKSKRVLIVGHTDDTGNSQFNADLSERRARAVARIFHAAGIPDSQIFFQGAGETLPIADNHTEEGRSKNRRVEIVDLSDENTFRAYLMARRPALAYYRETTSGPESGPKATQAAGESPRSANTTRRTAKAAQSSATTGTANPANASGASSRPNTSRNTASSNTVSAPAAPVERSAATASGGNGTLDFGGTPVADGKNNVDIGNVAASRSGFSLISSAQADEPLIGTCWRDRPRVGHGVKSLKTDKVDYSTNDYMPGMYGTSWTDTVNSNLVALTGVAVLRDGGLPAARPTLLVYRNYDARNRAKAVPVIKETPDVNVYRGDKAVLYRVFGSNAVRCLDLVIPYANSTSAPGSHLYYYRDQATYVTNFNPKIAK